MSTTRVPAWKQPRRCKLESCGVEFTPIKANHIYHSPECSQIARIGHIVRPRIEPPIPENPIVNTPDCTIEFTPFICAECRKPHFWEPAHRHPDGSVRCPLCCPTHGSSALKGAA